MNFFSNTTPWEGLGFTPRKWQKEALEIVMRKLEESANSLIVRAIMGAGKSVFLTELAYLAQERADKSKVVVIATSSVKLVEQLSETIQKRTGRSVGKYYTKKKLILPITVCCYDSIASLQEELSQKNKHVKLLICDECHRTECVSVRDVVLDEMKPSRCIGLTATPWRGSKKEELSLFEEVAYEYLPAQAIADRVIVPWVVRNWIGEEIEVDDACVQMIRMYGDGPGCVNAKSIEDCEAFSQRLEDEGFLAKPMHSELPAHVQTETIRAWKAGEIQIVVHVNMLSEGFDFPGLRWLCLRRESASKVRFPQEVGRVLRAAPGKNIAVVLDPHDLFSKNSIDYEAVLSGFLNEKDEKIFLEELEELEEEEAQGRGSPRNKIVYVKSKAKFFAWVSYMRSAFYQIGVLKNRPQELFEPDKPPTEAQYTYLHSLLPMNLPLGTPEKYVKAFMKAQVLVMNNQVELTKGTTVELIQIFDALKKLKVWPLEFDKYFGNVEFEHKAA